MALKLKDKKSIVEKISAVATGALAVVAVDYRGLKVNEMTDLRKAARQSGVHLQVVRNNLTRRALENSDFSCLHPILKGPIILIFSLEDVGAAARLLQGYMAKYDVLTVKGIAIGGQLLSADALEKIAKMPNREQALAIFLSALKLPFVRLVEGVMAPLVQVARVFVALGQK